MQSFFFSYLNPARNILDFMPKNVSYSQKFLFLTIEPGLGQFVNLHILPTNKRHNHHQHTKWDRHLTTKVSTLHFVLLKGTNNSFEHLTMCSRLLFRAEHLINYDTSPATNITRGHCHKYIKIYIYIVTNVTDTNIYYIIFLDN